MENDHAPRRRSSTKGIRIGSHQPHLGGKRIGPYTFRAKPKGASGPYSIGLTLCTRGIFLGAEGQPSDFEDAERVEEELLVVLLGELPKDRSASCPEQPMPWPQDP